MAVRQVPAIYEVLKQTPGDKRVADAYAELAIALRNVAAQGQMPALKRG